MRKKVDLTKILLPYSKKKLWVALNSEENRVVGYGKNPQEALNKAKKENIESPILLQALPDYSGFAPKTQE